MGVWRVKDSQEWVRSMGAMYLQHAPTTNRQKSMTEYQPRRGGKISILLLTILRIVRCSLIKLFEIGFTKLFEVGFDQNL